jgi:tape measure domain-containing protein
MGVIANLGVLIGANGAGLVSGLSAAKSHISDFRDSANSMFTSISFTGPAAGIAIATAGIYEAGKAAVASAADYETLEIAFTSLAGGAEQAKKLLSDLSILGAKTPFQFGDLAKATQTLMAYGFTADEAYGSISRLGDVASASTVGMAEGLNRISLAIGQIRAKGKTQTQELKQLAEVGITAFDALAVKLGVDVTKAMEMVEKGQVDAETGINAVISLAQDPKFAGLMQKQSESLNGLWSTLKDNASLAMREIGKVLIEGFDLKGMTADSSEFLADLMTHLGDFKGMLLTIGAIGRATFDVITEAIKLGVAALGSWVDNLGLGKSTAAAARETVIGMFEGAAKAILYVGNTLYDMGVWIKDNIIGPIEDMKPGNWFGGMFQGAQDTISASGANRNMGMITDFFDDIRHMKSASGVGGDFGAGGVGGDFSGFSGKGC